MVVPKYVPTAEFTTVYEKVNMVFEGQTALEDNLP